MGRFPPEITERKAQGLNETQKKPQGKGYSIKNSTAGLGHTPKALLRILVEKAVGQPQVMTIKTPPKEKQRLTNKGKEADSSLHITIDEGELSLEDTIDAPPRLEEKVNVTVDELKEVNLDTTKHPRPTYVSALLTPAEEAEYIALLTELRDVFSWTYTEIPGLDPKVALHYLGVKKGVRPVKQGQRRFRPEFVPSIEVEVNRLIDVGFMCEVLYPTWLSKIVPIRKKNGQIRNAGGTYHRAMQKIFDDMLHKNVKYYVDDLVVKSLKREDHPQDLRMVFERLMRYQLKMNPLKCAFGITSGKFNLGTCMILKVYKESYHIYGVSCQTSRESANPSAN
ncbi:hypothetical protein LIER_16584 [Lithospermum erythrorhizon]|uniref:Reverse transcriptase domain-containing protein n=1 Tax=Lithospermum erythrorhizon TaxID=34254 RepID=A0AAV3Q787_LITER